MRTFPMVKKPCSLNENTINKTMPSLNKLPFLKDATTMALHAQIATHTKKVCMENKAKGGFCANAKKSLTMSNQLNLLLRILSYLASCHNNIVMPSSNQPQSKCSKNRIQSHGSS